MFTMMSSRYGHVPAIRRLSPRWQPVQTRAMGSISAFDSVIFRNLFGTDEIRSVSNLILS